ncbi:MAG: beta-lactamase family protein, partial [bacterium]|nr:beta-lactamase family protein [bacterium]
MKRYALWALIAALLGSCSSATSPAVSPETDSPPKWRIAELMEEHNVPGVSVAVIDNGEIAWTKGYGVLETGAAQKVNAETLFQAASISKPVTAAAALVMIEAGKLSLDEDVNRKLTSWKVPANEFTRKKPVTLRDLFSHTAGMTVHGFPGYSFEADVPTVVEVLDGKGNTAPIRVDTEPGTLKRYSGGGYTVAQLLMTDVAGKPFPEILRETVLEPAGMTSSTFEQPLPEAL